MILGQTIIVIFLFIAVLLMIPGTRESEELKERFIKGYETTEKDSYIKTMREILRSFHKLNKTFLWKIILILL